MRTARTTLAVLGATLLANMLLAGAASAQTISSLQSLGICPGIVRSISADGSTVVGACNASGAWRWSQSQGYHLLPGNCSGANRASANGSVIVGDCRFSPTNPAMLRAARWVGNGAVQSLGVVPGFNLSSPNALSADGSVAAGYLINTNVGTVRGFVWTNSDEPLIEELQAPSTWQATTNARAISGDGLSVFGIASPTPAPGWTPTRWRANQPPFSMGMPPGETEAFPTEANADGTIVVGSSNVNFGAGWKWVEGVGYTKMPPPPGATSSAARDMTTDGLAAVGSFTLPDNDRAAFWTQTSGWIDLNTYLPTVGVNLAGWVLLSCEGVSDDGRTLVGNGLLNNEYGGWYVTGIPPICGPRVQLQPVNTTVCSFNPVSLGAFGVPPTSPGSVAYQWFRFSPTPFPGVFLDLEDGPTANGSVISGINTGVFTISNVSLADAGFYGCFITGGCGTTKTVTVMLTVLPDISGNGGSVDTSDLTVILGNFGNNVVPWTNGDLNGDGVVNTIDLTLFLGAFGTSCP